MKISELISELTKIQESSGDLPVYFQNCDYRHSYYDACTLDEVEYCNAERLESYDTVDLPDRVFLSGKPAEIVWPPVKV